MGRWPHQGGVEARFSGGWLRAALGLLGAPIILMIGASVLPGAFTDATTLSRIDYLHASPAAPQSAVFSAPAAAVDVDGDGWTDLVAGRADGPCVLYMNNRDGTFREEAVARGLGGVTGIGGIVAGDFSNSGRQDLFLVPLEGRRCHLMINDGTGRFTDQAAARGVELTTSIEPHAGFGISLADFDRDGYLDLHLSEWGVPSTAEDSRHSVLLRNRGTAAPGHFENVTASAGVQQPRIGNIHHGFSSAWADFDEDGWPDLALVGDFNTSQFFWNNGNGTFIEQARAAGVGLDENGMGVAVADYDGDGRIDFYVTSIFDRVSYEFSGLKTGNKLYRNLGGRRFAESAAAAGVDRTGWGWGAAFLDFDNDGDPDLLVTNGMTADYVPDPNLPHSTDPLTDPTTLFVNDGSGRFVDGTAAAGLRDTGQGRGVVVADFDNDGDEDVLITQAYGRPVLYRSDAAANGNRWIRLRLQGTLSNRDGIGAVVRITQAGRTRLLLHNPTNSFLGQREPILHAGLGSIGATIDSVEIRWPSGVVQTLSGLATNTVHAVVEPSGALSAPFFTVQPTAQTLAKDQPLVLTAAASGEPSPIYVWRKDGVELAGVSGPTYRVAKVHPFDAGRYTVQAINPQGAVTSVPVEVIVTADLSKHSIARWWNEALLDAIRKDFPSPTIHARTLFHLSAAMWDAFWAYQPEGWIRPVPLYVRENLTETDWTGGRETAQRQAISHAAYRVLVERYKNSPSQARSLAGFRWLMVQAGCDPDFSGTAGRSPAAVGNRIGFGVLAATRDDGSNEANGYADTSGYVPRNPPLPADLPGITLAEPNHWQPLSFNNAVTQNGIPLGAIVQSFIGVNWRRVEGFALAKISPISIAIDPGPPPQWGAASESAYRQSAVEVIRYSSMLDPSDGAMIDLSPGARLNHSLGAQDGIGRPLNPVTGQPYAANVVKRGDYARLLAEHWADGPASETPPGHWNLIFNQVADDPRFERRLAGLGPVLPPLEWDIRGYLALNGAVHDAAIAAWTLKRQYDSVRPISMIRYLAGLGQSSEPAGPAYHPRGLPLVAGLIEVVTTESSAPGQRHAHLAGLVGKLAIRSWQGSPRDPLTQTGGVGWISAARWVPYQPSTFVTPAFAGYVSGHSTFSRSAAEVMTLLTGSPFFPGGLLSLPFAADRSLLFEKGPSANVTFQFATYADAADEAGWSRLWGGIHVAADDFAGRRMGAQIGLDAFLKAAQLRNAADRSPGGLINLSARGRVGADDPDVMITGFVFSGQTPQSILLRSVGPGLGRFGVVDFTRDPNLVVRRSADNAVLASNQDWESGPRALSLPERTRQAGAFPLEPGQRDAADALMLDPGAYTVVTRSASRETSGIVLAEVYGRDLVNLSARSRVTRGEGAVIAGFVIEGRDPVMVLVRAVGPGLTPFGVTGVVADPVLRIFEHGADGLTRSVAMNDDWLKDDRASLTTSATRRAGAFPLAEGSQDAALLLQLNPGSYSAVVSGDADTEGVALVEVYLVR